jgi:hypothetical protein
LQKNYCIFVLLGLYFPSHREFEATVTEITSIAKRARIGSTSNTSNPIIETNVVVARGINLLLYTKACKVQK